VRWALIAHWPLGRSLGTFLRQQPAFLLCRRNSPVLCASERDTRVPWAKFVPNKTDSIILSITHTLTPSLLILFCFGSLAGVEKFNERARAATHKRAQADD
jgi:hypothetical protein